MNRDQQKHLKKKEKEMEQEMKASNDFEDSAHVMHMGASEDERGRNDEQNKTSASSKNGVELKKKKKKKSSKKTSRRSEGNDHHAGVIGDDKDRIRGQKLQYQQEHENSTNPEDLLMPVTLPDSDNNSSNAGRNDQGAISGLFSRPGAFRVFLWGQQRAEESERRTSASSSFFRRQPPLAHVERIEETNRDQDDNGHNNNRGDQYNDEMVRMEANRLHHDQQRRKRKSREEEDSNFWVMGAILIGVVLVSTVLIATLIVVRGKGGTEGNDLQLPPTPAPNSNVFETGVQNLALRELWADYSNLYVYAVQFGFDRSECMTSSASPRLTMVCGGTNSAIAIVAVKYVDAQGKDVEDTSFYSCDTPEQKQDTLNCLSTMPDNQRAPTIFWMVGCASNDERPDLQVQAFYDLTTTSSRVCSDGAICNNNQEQSHVSYSMSVGQFCFDESGFEPSSECTEGSPGLVDASSRDKTVPFCGLSNSCENNGGDDCLIDRIRPLEIKTTLFRPHCGLSKNSDQSFLDLFTRSQLWAETSSTFNIREFGPNTHAVLTNP